MTEKEKPQWKEARIKPFKGFVDQLRQLRDVISTERDRLEKELQEKNDKEDPNG